jgi:hypothetical protein
MDGSTKKNPPQGLWTRFFFTFTGITPFKILSFLKVSKFWRNLSISPELRQLT